MLTKSRQSGLSLVETMVAMTIGLFLLTGLVTFVTNNLNANRSRLEMTRLNQELRASMNVMIREIRRAGYWASPSYTLGPLSTLGAGTTYNNPFLGAISITSGGTTTTTNGGIYVPPSSVPGCILFSYDSNGNGIFDTTTPDERYGFLLDNGIIYMRTGQGATVNDCTTNAGNAWGALTNGNDVNYQTLTFSGPITTKAYLSGTSGPNTQVRYITITLTGQSKSDSSIQQTLTETVKLENDLFSAN